MNLKALAVFFLVSTLINCTAKTNYTNMSASLANMTERTDTATFGTGCFWCTEAIFEQLKGVLKVTSGYSGGTVNNPTYKQVCTGETGHAECVQIIYEPDKISYDELLQVFWQVHDPTTLNRQGADVGTQYRSAIFYHNDEQKEKAEHYKEALNKSGAFNNPIVTEIVPATAFYPAEDYHQEYYQNNKNTNPYCSIVIRPKLDKFKKAFADKLRSN
ncbi:MAG: peptide-methionine (S)-S-oxide reductase MsrA [Flavisolibacter sp.]|nr:peptide-methionine (S)-S-oxide reductase MsrA [Flavisolibacter sp.]MBD0286164.1 peptide-methionine (S)-S-oxide reductase MsrA [Flavisolibacter sp.]MBD0295257.1 peptide-methionine (S)-S-oxide reductase MsrA [Flavisolibacter sp.]MBD0352171.1 peptide-methionine (S)-S-oxide reductase MsrA [Flavisolibacter sp.]